MLCGSHVRCLAVVCLVGSENLVTLAGNFHDEILLWHLEVSAVAGFCACVVSDETEMGDWVLNVI